MTKSQFLSLQYLLLAAILCPFMAAADNAASSGYSGTFKDGGVVLTLARDAAAAGESYKGTIERGGQTYPLTASVKDGKLDGAFTDKDGNRFPFTASVDGGVLSFTTGHTTLKLPAATKAGPANPLDAVANPPTLAPAQGPVPISVPAPAQAPAQAPVPPNNARIPAWLKPGLRITYFGASATVASSGSVLVQNANGKWVDSNGKHYSDEENPGGAGAGYTQTDIVAVHDDAVTMEMHMYTMFGPGQFLYAPVTGAIVAPGEAGDTWIAPEELKQLANMDTPEVKVYRAPYQIGDKIYRGVFRSIQSAKSWSYHVYDEETGLLLHLAMSSVGTPCTIRIGEQKTTGTGDTYLVQVTFVSLRQLSAPWAGAPIPPAARALKQIAYEGAYVMNPAGLASNWPYRTTIKPHDGKKDYLPYTLTTILDYGMGGPPQVSMAERVTGSQQLVPLAIDPAELAKLQPGQEIDKDLTTHYAITVTSTGRDAVVLSEFGGATNPRFDYFYDKSSGLLIGVVFNDPRNYTNVRVSMKSKE